MFRPKIIGFTCNWSLPPEIGATNTNDVTGYPRIRIVRVTCVGRIDPVIALETLAKGADGILIIGCHPPDCHYVNGNLQAERTVKMLKKLVSLTGLEKERIKLIWYSPTDKKSFGHQIREFYEEIEKYGPSLINEEQVNTELEGNILAAKKASSDFRLRALLGREKELAGSANVYGEKVLQEDFDRLLDDVAKAEFMRYKIHILTKRQPRSVKALAKDTKMKPAMVLNYIVNMRRRNMIALDHIDGNTPFYKALEVG